jgi:hypothetical protein
MTQLTSSERRRYTLLLSNIENLFNRLHSDIAQLHNKNISLIGFSLATLSIVVVFFIFLIQNGMNLPLGGYILIGLNIALMILSLAINFKNFVPGIYHELIIFEKDRFNELKIMAENDLYADTIGNYEKAFNFNREKYDKMVWEFKISIGIYISAFVVLLIFLFLLIFVGV